MFIGVLVIVCSSVLVITPSRSSLHYCCCRVPSPSPRPSIPSSPQARTHPYHTHMSTRTYIVPVMKSHLVFLWEEPSLFVVLCSHTTTTNAQKTWNFSITSALANRMISATSVKHPMPQRDQATSVKHPMPQNYQIGRSQPQT